MSGEINARQNTKNNCFLILRTPQSQASEHWSSLHYKVPIVLMKQQQQQVTAPHPHQLYIIHLRQAQESSGCSSTITSEPSTQSHHPISSYPSSKWQHSHHIIPIVLLPNGRTQSYLVFVLVVVVEKIIPTHTKCGNNGSMRCPINRWIETKKLLHLTAARVI